MAFLTNIGQNPSIGNMNLRKYSVNQGCFCRKYTLFYRAVGRTENLKKSSKSPAGRDWARAGPAPMRGWLNAE
jgi:hypothetical protein